MKLEPLEYASPQMNGRRPRWMMPVVGFASISFASGMILDFTYAICHTPQAIEVIRGPYFVLLLVLRPILAGYSIFAMGLTAFVMTRPPCYAIARTWFMVLIGGAAYGALPAVCILLPDGSLVLCFAAGVVPIFFPFAFLRRSVDWPS